MMTDLIDLMQGALLNLQQSTFLLKRPFEFGTGSGRCREILLNLYSYTLATTKFFGWSRNTVVRETDYRGR